MSERDQNDLAKAKTAKALKEIQAAARAGRVEFASDARLAACGREAYEATLLMLAAASQRLAVADPDSLITPGSFLGGWYSDGTSLHDWFYCDTPEGIKDPDAATVAVIAEELGVAVEPQSLLCELVELVKARMADDMTYAVRLKRTVDVWHTQQRVEGAKALRRLWREYGLVPLLDGLAGRLRQFGEQGDAWAADLASKVQAALEELEAKRKE